MPLLSYEGVEVDLPADLAGIRFEFTAGSLTIRCRGFTGDVVLSKPAESGETSSSPAKKRTIDLSASDDEEEADAKRQRPNFLNEAEQTLLLAQLNDSQSSSHQKPKAKGRKPKAEHESDAVEAKDAAHDSADASDSATTGKTGKKTPTKKGKRKAKESVDAFFSPEPKQAAQRKATPDSSKKRSKTPKASPGKSIKDLMSGSPKPKPAAVVEWEMVEALGNAPPERWGHTATKISEERVVVYGGTDDDERTLGDLHVFDMKTHRWTTPLNCETITRTWHDAVYLSSKNLVLVFGGERNAAAEGELDILSDIMVLDTECFLWYPPAVRGSPPAARSGHTCTAVGNEVVVFGGSRGRNRQSSVHIFDSDDWNWKAVKVEGKPPSARTYHSAVAVGEDKIVYFGGNDSSKSFNEVHVLQKVEKKASDAVWTWFHPSVVGVPPQERTGHSAVLLNDAKILVFGGWDPQRDDHSAPTSVFNDAFLLDTKTWEWQPATYTDEGKTDTALRGRVGHGAVLGCDGRVHLFGGQTGSEQRLKDICTLTISQKQEAKTKEPKPEAQATSSDASTLETNSV
ncbi:kelch domain-containing protein 1 [Phytophthora pseudosyringae]|uniref:Kelch domain-containing protein 1 n=1 Tax=Phytophthora pseudosyringae TaxID=221518 RepID=A0A8T1VI03_9STRA|nr:kelch domain-containing protein 1 [Phytophthora pseudosyringae]